MRLSTMSPRSALNPVKRCITESEMMRRAVLSIVLAMAMAVAHAQAPPGVLGGAFELIDHNGQPFSSTS